MSSTLSVVRAWSQRLGSAPLLDCRALQNADGGWLSAGSTVIHRSLHIAVGVVVRTELGTSAGNA